MNTFSQGILINKAGHGRYANSDALEKLIKYITRTNGKPKDDLIAWGGLGITEFKDMDSIIRQFYLAQKMHTRRGNFGRYADHEMYSFSCEEEESMYRNKADADKIARKMAYDFYVQDGCQVIYGVHTPVKANQHLHIHFAVNTVNYKTGNKRRENKQQLKEREQRFHKIVSDEIKKGADDIY